MTPDHRLTPDPVRVSINTPARIAESVVDLCRAPSGPRDRQAIYGEALTVFAREAGWAYVQLEKDGYCGYIPQSALTTPASATHKVSAPATHAYSAADLKSPERLSLTFGALVEVTETRTPFARTEAGFIPIQHLSPVDTLAADPGDVAQLFLGTPYLWGGNSRWGIDCSGLVQAAFLACGIPCPGDSDQQQRSLGDTVPTGGAFMRNDLLFWKGHVAIALAPDLMIHANAHAMAVTLEPIADAIQRIAAKDGALTAHKRVSLSERR